MRNFQAILFLHDLEYIGRFSNLHWCTFKEIEKTKDVCNIYMYIYIQPKKVNLSIFLSMYILHIYII